jgi:hypothetical protein
LNGKNNVKLNQVENLCFYPKTLNFSVIEESFIRHMWRVANGLDNAALNTLEKHWIALNSTTMNLFRQI